MTKEECEIETSKAIMEMRNKIAELRAQLAQMNCCENCRYYSRTYAHCYSYEANQSCTSLSNWRLAEC